MIFRVVPLFLIFLDQGGLCRLLMIALESPGFFYHNVDTILSDFHNMVQSQFGVKIKRFTSENAGDYFNQALTPYF